VFNRFQLASDSGYQTSIFDVRLTYHSTNFQIVHGIIARVVPASSGQINFGTFPTTYLGLYGSVIRHGGGATRWFSLATNSAKYGYVNKTWLISQ